MAGQVHFLYIFGFSELWLGRPAIHCCFKFNFYLKSAIFSLWLARAKFSRFQGFRSWLESLPNGLKSLPGWLESRPGWLECLPGWLGFLPGWLELAGWLAEAQRGPERPRDAQRRPERLREGQRSPETPRSAIFSLCWPRPNLVHFRVFGGSAGEAQNSVFCNYYAVMKKNKLFSAVVWPVPNLVNSLVFLASAGEAQSSLFFS